MSGSCKLVHTIKNGQTNMLYIIHRYTRAHLPEMTKVNIHCNGIYPLVELYERPKRCNSQSFVSDIGRYCNITFISFLKEMTDFDFNVESKDCIF